MLGEDLDRIKFTKCEYIGESTGLKAFVLDLEGLLYFVPLRDIFPVEVQGVDADVLLVCLDLRQVLPDLLRNTTFHLFFTHLIQYVIF